MTATQNLEDLSERQLVVEAVVIKKIQIKEKIFRTLGPVARPNFVLLSNTSRLDIHQMASVLDPVCRSLFAG